MLSSSPDDLSALTPGHFLIGTELLARPELNVTDLPANRLDRWQITSQIVQGFWRRWVREYLHSLIHRPKWNKPTEAINEGAVVYWYQPDAPPTHWPLGIVDQTILGNDGVVRSLRIRSTRGMVTRPVNKVVVLPTSA